MKTLTFNNNIFKAEKIIKTENSIIGQDLQGNEVFAFRGISDFSLFELEEGQSFDMDEKELLKQELTKTNAMVLELTEIILGGM